MKALLFCLAPRTGPGSLSVGGAVCLFAFALILFTARPATAQEHEGLSPAEMAARGKAAFDNGDYEGGVKWSRMAAERGNARGQNNLGASYANGLGGVSKDLEEAVKWYRRAAEQGFAPAQHNLGILYAKGAGVAQDDAKAVKWYHRAAEQGYAPAQTSLGRHYAKGLGVAQDDAETVKWLRRAAEQGDALAQTNLGFMYTTGRGVARDDAEAAKWFRRAAERGVAPAQSSLGFMYANGRGVVKDQEEAVKWYRLAAEQGDERAQSALEHIERAEADTPREAEGSEKKTDFLSGLFEVAKQTGKEAKQWIDEQEKAQGSSGNAKRFRHVANAAISGHDTHTFRGISVSDCMSNCLSLEWCKSFDYHKIDQTCNISNKNAQDVGGLKTNYPGNPYDHYEKK